MSDGINKYCDYLQQKIVLGFSISIHPKVHPKVVSLTYHYLFDISMIKFYLEK